MCRNETVFLQDGCFARGIKRICLAAQSKIFRRFYGTFTLYFFPCPRHIRRHLGTPPPTILSFFFPHPILLPQFVPLPSLLSHSPPPLRLPSRVLGLDFESLFSQFISNWHFMEFNLQGGTMGTFHHTEWYEKPQTLWMGSERQNKINKWVSQSDPEYWWQEPQRWATLHFNSEHVLLFLWLSLLSIHPLYCQSKCLQPAYSNVLEYSQILSTDWMKLV